LRTRARPTHRSPSARNWPPCSLRKGRTSSWPYNSGIPVSEVAMPRVLIADDNPQNAELLDAHLDGTGYETRIASNGEEAVAEARAWVPDVVLLDVMMPKLSGFEVCKRLKA